MKKEYPNAKLFTVIPLEDIKGKLESYIFSYYIGPGEMPPMDKVKADISNAWKLKMEVSKKITEAYNNGDSSTMIEWMEKLQPYDYKIRQPQEYIALEIAANYDSPPVKKSYNGLPYNLAMYPNAEEILAETIKDMKGVEFKRTFKIDMLATGFEFQDVENNKQYYVDVLNNAVFNGWEEQEEQIEKIDTKEEQERIKNIQRQWKEFLSL